MNSVAPEKFEVPPTRAEAAPSRQVDPLIVCLARVAKHFDTPFAPATLASSLAFAANGTLPWHQAGPALDLLGLNHDQSAAKRLPLAKSYYPMILRDGEGTLAVLLDREGDDVLAWRPGDIHDAWRPASDFDATAPLTLLSVEGDPSTLRDAGQPWHQRARAHWFWSEIARRRSEFWPVIVASVIINLLAVSLPIFTMNVYDRVIPNRASASLWVLALGVAIAFALEYALRKARTNVLDEISRDLDVSLSQKIYARVMSTPLAAKSGHTGNLVARVSEYAIVRDFFAATTITLMVDVIFLFIFIAFMAIIAGPLALIPLVIMGGMIVLGFRLQRQITDTTRDAQADYGLQQTQLVESIAGLETLKSIAGEGEMLGRWRRISDMASRSQKRLREVNSTAIGAASTFQQISTISLVIGGYYMFDAGIISMGAIIAIVMLSSRALAPAGQLAYLLTRWKQASETLDSIERLWDGPDERKMGSTSLPPQVRSAQVAMQGVTFAYPGSSVPSLKDINLSIRPGERIAVVGRVASGKSTLGRILCGLYEPDSGAVLIDGIDARQYRPHDVRRNFRFVAQDANLFSGTIKDNLALGGPRASEQQLIDALRKVGADTFLSRDAGGFDRAVGEGGRSLSGGQRNFLALARAFVSPCQLLFLDEPTGAMDMQTEKLFIDALSQSLTPSQTLVVSTHRPALFALCDRVIVVSDGQIVADGQKDEVIKSAGI
ncbi:ATP-binding cassette domain-containing protein [Croceicoccus sp. BE223]|uniref:ATP-binding cassette domain-containing protein n=1 Tax=Croceicoccus sp. BE223 TaxID=2817716 RepID=UPI0028610CF7|nr:ATP-binding cassette domain-containing protein [Croceicoccus sp. BE223]MDR7103035.1 ATP-binding cassette subfamily C protein LapB [Croceicoccus sp. BE223]